MPTINVCHKATFIVLKIFYHQNSILTGKPTVPLEKLLGDGRVGHQGNERPWVLCRLHGCPSAGKFEGGEAGVSGWVGKHPYRSRGRWNGIWGFGGQETWEMG